MSSTELAIDAAMIGGMDSIYLVTVAATVFLFASMVFFTLVAIGPYLKPSALTEGQKNAFIGLGTAAVGLMWMVAVLLAAGTF